MAFDKGHALIIGVGTYKNKPADNVPMTVGDAKALAATLMDPECAGYPPAQVKQLFNDGATRDNILQALDDLALTQPDDTVLIFYSGHGLFGTDKTYFLTTHDTEFPNDQPNADTGIARDILLTKLHAIPAQRAVLIFNACNAGEIPPDVLGDPVAVSSIGENLTEDTATAILGSGSGRVVITACGSDEQSFFAHNAEKTIFGQTLTAGLTSTLIPPRQGFICVFDLYTFLFENVSATIAHQFGRLQRPEIWVNHGVGDMPLAQAPVQAAVVPPTPGPPPAPLVFPVSPGRGEQTIIPRGIIRSVNEDVSRGLFNTILNNQPAPAVKLHIPQIVVDPRATFDSINPNLRSMFRPGLEVSS